MKPNFRFNKNLTNFLTVILHAFFSDPCLQLISLQNKTVAMLQEPVKLLKKEQFVLLNYHSLTFEGVTIYTQLTLVSNRFQS